MSNDDRKVLFLILARVAALFGSADLEWFCACETALNGLFALKSREAHEHARLFLN